MKARKTRGEPGTGRRIASSCVAAAALDVGAGMHRTLRRCLRRPASVGILVLGMAIGWPCHAGPFEFAVPVALPGGSTNPYAVEIGDVDGDGRDDVLVTDAGSSLQIHLQSAGGALQAAQTHLLAVDSVRSMRLADIDQDGEAELLVGHGNGIAVRSGSDAWRYVWSLDDCEIIDVADVDMDGWSDVVCFSLTGYANTYFNDGNGGFHPPVDMLTPAQGIGTDMVQMRVRDVTGDGAPDLVISSSAAPGFYVHRNDGNGGFLPAYGYGPAGLVYPGPHGLEIMDVDNDGVDEIVITSLCIGACPSVHVYRRDALGHFSHAQDIQSSSNPTAPLAHDLDRDGNPDLLVMHSGIGGGIGRFMGNASTGLSGVERWSRVPGIKRDGKTYALGDIDGDDCTDLVAATVYGVVILHGRCTRRATSDFDGDGRSDALWRNPPSGYNLIWRSGSAAQEQAVTTVADPGWQAVAQGDFDDDGKADILWRHAARGENVLWLSGDSATQRELAPLATAWKVAGVADFDGDGTADILWRHATTGQNMIWKAGYDAPAQAVTGVTDLRWQVAGVGDFDGDGRADILWRHATTGSNAVWKSANYATQQPVSGVTDARWRVAGVGDFDGDGRSDVLWRHATTGRNAIWRSADYGSQQPVTAVTNMDWQVFAVADYDGDGRADLFWRNPRTGENVIWQSANHATQTSVSPLIGARWTMPGR